MNQNEFVGVVRGIFQQNLSLRAVKVLAVLILANEPLPASKLWDPSGIPRQAVYTALRELRTFGLIIVKKEKYNYPKGYRNWSNWGKKQFRKKHGYPPKPISLFSINKTVLVEKLERTQASCQKILDSLR